MNGVSTSSSAKQTARKRRKAPITGGAAILSVVVFCLYAADTSLIYSYADAIHRSITSKSNNFVLPKHTTTRTTESQQFCELPSCDLVLRSRLYSERCGSNESGFPLLITATPRSATVYTRTLLSKFGMEIADDWSPHTRHARVSWIHAFSDPQSYGPPYIKTNLTYTHVLHQMRNPLSGITSMCTENVQYMKRFLERHVEFTIPVSQHPMDKPHIVLEWWVAWHSFLTNLQIPTFQIETVQAHDIFEMAGLQGLYNTSKATSTNNVDTSSNRRRHRQSFSWQEIFTIDPNYAAKAWKLAHTLGYSYPEVDFDSLVCLPELPLCSNFQEDNDDDEVVVANKSTSGPSPTCPTGTHPIAKIGNIPSSPVVNGWVSGMSCVEHKQADGTFVGLADVTRGEMIPLTAPYFPKNTTSRNYKVSMNVTANGVLSNLQKQQLQYEASLKKNKMMNTARKSDESLSRNNDSQQQNQQEHCVVHVHGFQHSGTGFMRKTIYKGLGGPRVASIHENTTFPEDEGQFLQTVYPRFDTRVKTPGYCWRDNNNGTKSVGEEYHCPTLLSIAAKKGKAEKLMKQWSSHWDMSKPFLIQKTPTMDVLFLEKTKLHKTVHAIVMRHPFACQPEMRNPNRTNSALFAASVWLLNWAHILENLANGEVASFVVVKFETLVEHHDEVSKELSTLIQNECGIPSVETTESFPRRRLNLHNGAPSGYLLGKPQVRYLNVCEQDEACQRFMDEAAPIMSQLGYNWDASTSFLTDSSFLTDDSKLLFTPSKLPPRELVEQIRELALKYRVTY